LNLNLNGRKATVVQVFNEKSEVGVRFDGLSDRIIRLQKNKLRLAEDIQIGQTVRVAIDQDQIHNFDLFHDNAPAFVQIDTDSIAESSFVQPSGAKLSKKKEAARVASDGASESIPGAASASHIPSNVQLGTEDSAGPPSAPPKSAGKKPMTPKPPLYSRERPASLSSDDGEAIASRSSADDRATFRDSGYG
jgi:hypothetical protein